MEKSKITNIRNWLAYIVGLSIIQLGVAIFLDLNLGSDPFTIFTQGVSRTFQITPGMANRILTLIILVILLFGDKKYINIGTIIPIIIAGFIMDAMLTLINPLQLGSFPIAIKIILFILNCVVIGVGFSIMKLADLGIAPNDVVYMTLVDYLHQSYGKVRMEVDAIYLIVGIFMDGVVGIGTVICIICLGPIVEFVMKHLEKHILKFL